MGLGASAPDMRRLTGEQGASLVEYALLISLIAVVCLGALNYFQDATTESFSKSASTIVSNT
jgi:Flp pilus assembly pilin Flp